MSTQSLPGDSQSAGQVTPVMAGCGIVAVAAALWGTDALFRRGLALELPAATVVFYEHLLLTVATLPMLFRVPLRSFSRADWAAIIVIGAGSSALATTLFTAAFRYGDPTTPLLLQKLQPVVALIAANFLLGERLRPRFWAYFLFAVLSAYLITFSDPLAVRTQAATAGALAVGAAVLWGLGTVLGRRLTANVTPTQLTSLRFAVGLPASGVLLIVAPEGPDPLRLEAGDLVPLVLLALIPGLTAILLYYRGLSRTPASAATLAELAFPLSAVIVNYLAFGATLTATQWVGTLGLAATLLWLSWAGRFSPRSLGIRVRRLAVNPD